MLPSAALAAFIPPEKSNLKRVSKLHPSDFSTLIARIRSVEVSGHVSNNLLVDILLISILRVTGLAIIALSILNLCLGTTSRFLGRAILLINGLVLDFDSQVLHLLLHVLIRVFSSNVLSALGGGLFGQRGLFVVGVGGDLGLALCRGLAGGSLSLLGGGDGGSVWGGGGASSDGLVGLANLGEVFGEGLSGGWVAEGAGWNGSVKILMEVMNG